MGVSGSDGGWAYVIPAARHDLLTMTKMVKRTRTASGDPIRPYDMSADVIAEFIGVKADPVATAVEAPLTAVSHPVEPAGRVAAVSVRYGRGGWESTKEPRCT